MYTVKEFTNLLVKIYELLFEQEGKEFSIKWEDRKTIIVKILFEGDPNEH